MDFLKLIWVIPLFPAAGAVINGLLGKKLPKRLIDIVQATAALAVIGNHIEYYPSRRDLICAHPLNFAGPSIS